MAKKIITIGAGLFLAVLILALLEAFFQINKTHLWLTKSKPTSGFGFDTTQSLQLARELADPLAALPTPLLSQAEGDRIGQHEEEDKTLIGESPCCIARAKFCRNCEFESRVRFRIADRDIYRVHFTLDGQGRRITPQSPNPRYNILLFGDSFTVGDGVEDRESAPFRLGVLRPEAQVYNLGLSGGAPSEVYYELTHPAAERFSDIARRKTIIAYSFIDSHMERLFCRSDCLRPARRWMLRLPFYEQVDGAFVLRGTFGDDRNSTNFIYAWLNRSAFLDFFNFTWPPRFTSRHFDFLADMLVAAREQARQNFDLADFYLVLYPGRADLYGERLAEACRRKGVPVLNYAPIDMALATQGRASIPGDGHPSAAAQLVFAHLLDRDLPRPVSN